MEEMSNSKKIPPGFSFCVPLPFGDWPIEKIEKIIKEVEAEYDLSHHRLSFVDRGRYTLYSGYGEHKEWGELIETFGNIVWERVR
jgi:hypothetical protein